MQKIAYISKIQLSDVDLSYLHEGQKTMDITCYMEVTPRFKKGPAFNIEKIYPHSGIYKLTDAYPEYVKYGDFIDIDKFYVVNTCGKLWQLKAFWTNFLLLINLIKGKFDTIHLVWPPNIYEFLIYILRKKMMLTVHDPFPHTGQNTLIVRLRRKVAFLLIPKLIILNKVQRLKFLNYYGISPYRVIDSALSSYDYLKTVEMDESTLPKEKFILFAGKISPYKGVDYLLSAMREVHKSFPDYKLVIAGGGKYYFNILEYEKLPYIDIRNRFIPDEELVALIQYSDFLVCPYIDATQSGVIMSAFAFCKPVIVTNVGGLPDMVRNGELGLVVREKDVNSLVNGIKQLLCSPELLAEYVEKIGQTYGKGDLSWKQIAENLKLEYEKI